MTSPDVFIGVVSYEGSKFSVSQGPDGLAAQLVREFDSMDVSATMQVNTQNLFDPHSLALTESTVQACLSAQISLDLEWADFLQRPRSFGTAANHVMRKARRLQQRFRSPGLGMVKRLLNIELSHLDLMRAGLDSGSPWVLILEDDAATLDTRDCALGLAGLMRFSDILGYVNVSESFTAAELGVQHLLHSIPDVTWEGSSHRSVLYSSRPATNTVCAILYERAFLTALVEAMDALPMEPVVPIDWKLNLALMELYRQDTFTSRQCWFVEPGPIDQLSMR